MPLGKEGSSMPFSDCAVCGEGVESRVITLALPSAVTGIAVFRNVPAEVCPRCGETRFSLSTTSRLMAVVRSDPSPADVATVPIYDLAR